MKPLLVLLKLISWISLVLGITSFTAQKELPTQPKIRKKASLGEISSDEFTYVILPFFEPSDLFSPVQSINSEIRAAVYDLDDERWQKRVADIDELIGKWIELPNSNAEIMATGISQELWVRVMRNNPSWFKSSKYCPDSYKKVVIEGKEIEMCADFPVEKVAAQSEKDKDSDEEFIAEMNRIYENAGRKERFRRQTRAEYYYADTNGDKDPKRADDLNLGEFTPHKLVSWNSPSGKGQPRSFTENRANPLDFVRSGVWEWVEDMDYSDRGLVGGSWNRSPREAASGFKYSLKPNSRYLFVGPSRLVRYKKVARGHFYFW